MATLSNNPLSKLQDYGDIDVLVRYCPGGDLHTDSRSAETLLLNLESANANALLSDGTLSFFQKDGSEYHLRDLSGDKAETLLAAYDILKNQLPLFRVTPAAGAAAPERADVYREENLRRTILAALDGLRESGATQCGFKTDGPEGCGQLDANTSLARLSAWRQTRDRSPGLRVRLDSEFSAAEQAVLNARGARGYARTAREALTASLTELQSPAAEGRAIERALSALAYGAETERMSCGGKAAVLEQMLRLVDMACAAHDRRWHASPDSGIPASVRVEPGILTDGASFYLKRPRNFVCAESLADAIDLAAAGETVYALDTNASARLALRSGWIDAGTAAFVTQTAERFNALAEAPPSTEPKYTIEATTMPEPPCP